MDLSEKIYDAIQESTPKQLQAGEYHIPFQDKISNLYPDLTLEEQIKVSVGMAANTSYTLVGDGNIINLEKASRIHDKCKELNHSSVFEHCSKAMSANEYYSLYRGEINISDEDEYNIYSDTAKENPGFGWCRNFKGFIPYRHLIETS
jgi:hypothetical protein